MKPERVGGEHVDHQPADEGGNSSTRPRAMDPFGSGEPRRLLARTGGNQQGAADRDADSDEARKPRRAELLARHRRESLDVPEDDPGEGDERSARQRIVDFYLASPTAFTAAPTLPSASPINFAVPADPPPLFPTPPPPPP